MNEHITIRPASTGIFFNCKYFDQLLQTVKNKTTLLTLVFKEFLQASIRPQISVLYANGYHDFQLINFCLTVPKNFVEEPFCVSENYWYRKMLGIKGGGRLSRFSVRIVLSHSTKKHRRGTLRCFKKFLVSKNFMLQRVMSRASVKNFCLTVSKHFVEEPFVLCCRKFPVAEKYMDEGGWGSIMIFLSKFLLNHSAENFSRNESFSVSIPSGIEKIWFRGSGGESRFSVENFFSRSAQKFS